MYAIIRAAAASRAPLASIAGKALIVRQLQWLRAVGCDRLVVELGDDETGDAVSVLLDETEAVGEGIVLVSSAGELSDHALAARGGIPRGAPFLVIAGDVIGDGDLTRVYVAADEVGAVAHFTSHSALAALEPAGVVLIGRRPGPRVVVEGRGWAAHVRSAADALAVTEAVLSGRLASAGAAWPIQVHAAEIRPGVWIARGADVDPTAVLVAPVLVGTGARILADARVGPGAVVGAGAVVGRGVTVEHAEIEPRTLVADGVAIHDCVAGPGKMELLSGEEVPVDPRLLDRVGSGGVVVGIASRFAALVLFVLAAPLLAILVCARGAAGVALADDLLEVASGRRALVGVRARFLDAPDVSARLRASAGACPIGVIDVSRAVVPAFADPVTELRARAWYAGAKSPSLDLRLVLRALFARRIYA